MRRLALALAALSLLWAGAAQAGQQWLPPMDALQLQDWLKQQNIPGNTKTVRTIMVNKGAYLPPPPPATIVVKFDGGGELQTYEARWRAIAIRREQVAIMDGCQSACTLVVAFVPKDKICFGDFAYLAFHQATFTGTGRVSVEGTRWMFEQYPLEIQAWIEAQGGPEEMPHSDTRFWTLPAKKLWMMGYRRCAE